MDVTKNRVYDKVVILGSGPSILELNDSEIEYINKCKKVIALNKFMGFYKKSGIIPTHIYFHDNFSGFEMYLYILKVCKYDNLRGLTLYTNSFLENITIINKKDIFVKIFKDLCYYRLRSLVSIIKNGFPKGHSINKKIIFRDFKYYYIPGIKKINSFEIANTKDKCFWANSFKDKIYHYRGSLSSILNIVSFEFPKTEIILVGTDFYSANYFYENELESTDVEWKDFTYNLVKNENVHFSFQNNDGTKISDAFPVILECLKKSGNTISCNNKLSLLVTECGVPFKKIF